VAAEPDLDELAAATARPYAVPLAGRCSAERLIARLGVAEQPAVLSGRWFGGGVLVMRRPLAVRYPQHASDGFEVLAIQPAADRPAAGVVGGGWVAGLGFGPGTTTLGYYDSLLRWRPDHGWAFEALGLPGRADAEAAALQGWRAELAAAEAEPPDVWAEGPVLTDLSTFDPPHLTRDRYLAAVEDAIGRIHRGDFYQVNLCTRVRGRFTGAPARLFARVVADLQPDYAALVSGPGGRTVACFSPELFLRLRGRTVTTSPIKGTAARAPGEDDSVLLRTSAKDAAENVMIVDLMRHDLAQVSEPGTVAVSELLALRPHPGVWHLVSTVTAQLAVGAGVADLLRAAFPPGSVTGAPKSSALRAIAELEPVPRAGYTGSLGLLSPTAGAELNVTIRSFEVADGSVELGIGGGITADSVPIREWYECWHKAAPLAAAAGAQLDVRLPRSPVEPTATQRAAGVFESVLVAHGEPVRMAAHLARLDRSCRELYGEGLPDDLPTRLRGALAEVEIEPRAAARVVARPAEGRLEVEVSARALVSRRSSCRLALQPRTSSSWRHKWFDRSELSAAEEAAGDALPYFTVEEGGTWVTETSRGNLFCRSGDGVWLTPPLDEHLLPGVTRREVLDLMAELEVPVEVRRFGATRLRNAGAAFWTSSLSGVVAVTAVDGRALPAPPPLLAELNRRLRVLPPARR
jgi:para-aminobenzoate synthetase/4-amino-4-deoxychorismate lyase